MSRFRIVTSIVGLAFVAAFVAQPVDVRSEVTTQLAPVAAKADRSEILASGDAWACADEPWPYGCQWRTPSKRVLIRTPRPI
jgi:hypothetical protein